MVETKSEYILVVGCGRLGSHLASQLSRDGHSVVVIDPDERKFSLLGVEFGGFRLEGDATELAVLKQAKAGQADRLIAVTPDDNVNLTVVQMGKKLFGIPVAVARLSDPARERVFREIGVTTICPLTVTARDLLEQVAAGGGGRP